MTICRVQDCQLSLLYFLFYFPLIVSDAISCPLHNLKTLWYIIMILYSYVEQVLTMCHVQEWQLSLHTLCFQTLQYIIMILYSYVEQVLTMCRVQDWQLWLSYFLSYFPLIVSDAISCPLHNLKPLWYIIMILYSYVEQVLMTMCRIQEWQLLLSYFPTPRQKKKRKTSFFLDVDSLSRFTY